MSLTERLALIIDASASGAVREIDRLGVASKRTDATVTKLGATNTQAAASTSKLGATAGVAGAAMQVALAGGAIYAGSKILAFAGDSVQAASDLAESQNKTKVVFGDSADSVLKFGENAAKSLGMSENAAISAASGFGQFFDAAGMSEKASASMSTELVKLAADLASFNNLDPGVALEKLRSGLAGETEPLRQVGVFLNEASVKAKAMQLGLVGAHGELSDGAKIQARYQLILEQTSKAQGDFKRTSEGLANQQRINNALWEDTRAKIGEALLPLKTEATKAANDAIPLLAALAKIPEGIRKIAEIGPDSWALFQTGLDDATGSVDKLDESLRRGGSGTFAKEVEELTVAEESASVATEKYADTLSLLSDPLGTAGDRATALGDAFGYVYDGLDRLTSASVSFEGDLDKLTEKFNQLEGAERTSAQALDIHEESGRDTVGMLQDLRDDAVKAAEAVLATGGSAKDAAGKYSEHAGQIDAVIGKLGINRAEAIKLIGQYDQIPSSISTAVSVETARATNSLDAFRQRLLALDGSVATAYTRLVSITDSGQAGPTGRAIGGPVDPDHVYRVGESGPEWFVPNEAGQVVPDGRLTGGGGGAVGGVTVNVYAGSVIHERDLVRTVRDGLARLGRRGDPMAA